MSLRERPALDIDIKIRPVVSVILPNTTGGQGSSLNRSSSAEI